MRAMSEDKAQSEQETENFEVVTNEGATPDPAIEPEKQVEKQEPQESETEEKPDSESPDTKQERGSNRFQKKIDRLTKRAAEAERAVNEERQKREALELKLAGKKEGGEELDPASFDSYTDYLDALAQAKEDKQEPEKVEKSEQKKPEEAKAEPVDHEFNDALEDVQVSFAEASSKYADFEKVVTAPDLAITNNMVKALAETDDPAGLAYYLGKNKEEAARIAALKPLAIAREFGRIEAKLAHEPQKRTTQAPDPITPVSGSDGSEPALEDLSFPEYEAAMNKKTQRKGFW